MTKNYNMKNVNIEIPEGFEIDLKNSNLSKGNITFKKKEIKLPVTDEGCLNFIKKDGYYINNNGLIANVIYEVADEINFITTREYAEAFLALMQLIKFRDIWNEGWKADWTNDDIKYVITIYNEKKSHIERYTITKILTFKTFELRDKFSKTFNALIQTAKPLL